MADYGIEVFAPQKLHQALGTVPSMAPPFGRSPPSGNSNEQGTFLSAPCCLICDFVRSIDMKKFFYVMCAAAGLLLAGCGGDGGPGPNLEPNPVTAFNLTGLVTRPVKNTTPDTTAINTDQYTGIIIWQTQNGASHTDPFAASCALYRAGIAPARIGMLNSNCYI
jgi:hypothetical protein